MSPVVLLLFLLSGATGLVYELVWTRQLVFVFGGTTHAITTVLVAFMGGLGLGSYIAGRLSDRLQRPAIGYGVLEILIGGYALAVPLLLGLAEPLYRSLYAGAAETPGLLTAARFAVGCLVLLLPTTWMGATLPLLVRFATLRGQSFGNSVALLYAVNSLGAALGVVATGFFLIPMVGLARTTQIAAGTNIVLGIIALLLLRGTATPAAPPRVDTPPPPPSTGRERLVLLVFAASGCAALACQLTWTRAVVMSIGSSTYAFSCILAAFILGLSLGGFAATRIVAHLRDPVRTVGWLQFGIAAASLLTMPFLGRLPRIVHYLIVEHELPFERLLAIEFACVLAVMLPATFLMGCTFPIVTRAICRDETMRAAATGRAYAANTIGTIVGSLVAGFLLMSSVGIQNTIVLSASLSALGGAALLWPGRDATTAARRPALLGLLAVLALAAGTGVVDRWNPLEFSGGQSYGPRDPQAWARDWKEVFHRDGVDMTVVVGHKRDNTDVRFLAVNGKTDASSDFHDMTTQLLFGHLPALVSPRLERTCVIGLGCGVTVAALARHEQVGRIDCAEISDGVIIGAQHFNDFTYNALRDDPRIRMVRADGRNHLLLTDRAYDLIVSEPSNPWIAGVANLFTREFFELCRSRLAPDGVACFWLQGYAMAPEDFRMVVGTLTGVFPDVSLWVMNRHDYALIARNHEQPIPYARMRDRFASPLVRADLYRVGLGQLPRVLGTFLAGDAALRTWSAGTITHTDDNARLEFSAPRQMYRDHAGALQLEIAGLIEPVTRVVDFADDADALERIERISAAKIARLASRRAVELGDARGGMLSLVESYTHDPHIATYLQIQLLAESLQHNPELARAHPEAAEALLEVAGRANPVCTLMTGETLPDLVERIRGEVDALEAAGRWTSVAQQVGELLTIAPDDIDLQVRFARAAWRTGQIETARTYLRAALAADRAAAEKASRAMSAEPALADLFD